MTKPKSLWRSAWEGIRNALIADAVFALAIALLVTLSDLGWL
jgi:hypothetical protein